MKDRLILEFPDFLPKDKVKWIRETARANLCHGITKTYNREGTTVNITEVAEKSSALAEVDAYMYTMFGELVQKSAAVFNPIFEVADSGYEYHLYPVGSICKEHYDGEISLGASKYTPDEFNAQSMVRYATAVIFLTDNNGGELVFPNSDVFVKPEAGKAVVFPPYGSYIHYSKPATEDREIIMTWLVYSKISAVLL